MPVTWLDLRDLAKDLIAADPCSEARARSSISRAYYAAFHALGDLVHVVPGEEPRYGARGLGHRQIAARLRDWRLAARAHPGLAGMTFEARQIAHQYQACLEAREGADYDLDLDSDVESARMQLHRAQDLINFAVRLKKELERLNIAH